MWKFQKCIFLEYNVYSCDSCNSFINSVSHNANGRSCLGNTVIDKYSAVAMDAWKSLKKMVNIDLETVSRLPSKHLDEQLCRWTLIVTTLQHSFIM